jgi:hypothetical protein
MWMAGCTCHCQGSYLGSLPRSEAPASACRVATDSYFVTTESASGSLNSSQRLSTCCCLSDLSSKNEASCDAGGRRV